MMHWNFLSPWWGISLFICLFIWRVMRVIYRRAMDAERVIGEAGSVKREAMMMCAAIREFVAEFVATHGPLPVRGLAINPIRKAEMETAQADWCARFAAAFYYKLGTAVESLLRRLRAEGQNIAVITPLLQKPNFSPNDALEVAAQIFKLTLRLGAVYERQVNDLQP